MIVYLLSVEESFPYLQPHAALPALPALVPSALRSPHTCSRPHPPLASCWCSVHHCSHCYSSGRQPSVGQAHGTGGLLRLSATTLLCRRSRLIFRTASTACASSGCMTASRHAVQHHCASPHAVCACSPSGSPLPIGLATAHTSPRCLAAPYRAHLACCTWRGWTLAGHPAVPVRQVAALCCVCSSSLPAGLPRMV